ncbi:MAG TPA: hypothetical protein VGV85_00905 [Longimicrobiaceae bacterium]|nr:hypothetical protein [Longimicrobiaceae bacterium]
MNPLSRAALAAVLLCAPGALAAQVTVTSDAVEEREARPGESYTGTIRLRNVGTRPEEARVYRTDYGYDAEGRTRFGDPGTEPRSSAAWITASPARVVVPPGGEATVAYSVRVPDPAPLPGTYWSVVMVEGVPEAADSARQRRPDRAEVGVRPTVRYAIQLATHVGGTGTRQVEFARVRALGAQGGNKRLEFDLVNSGELAFRPELRVELFDGTGAPVGTFTRKRGLFYPGTTLRQSFDLGTLPAGSYQALVVADAGGESVFGAQYTLRL